MGTTYSFFYSSEDKSLKIFAIVQFHAEFEHTFLLKNHHGTFYKIGVEVEYSPHTNELKMSIYLKLLVIVLQLQFI